jgi:hypothetical protein
MVTPAGPGSNPGAVPISLSLGETATPPPLRGCVLLRLVLPCSVLRRMRCLDQMEVAAEAGRPM